ncbi:hypothetical protein NMG29_04715 [Streptomyces cocklensis]|uniref:Uncharacterized protein n=1 Tax=Actinacidiphila cocklensis TaxID=887465 RepID=A0A9W4GQQ2_9ACTN|nr:hypothetical protein [Actinacidiphila cocklensis]MDD1057531.1 hypothetical protein [Actinacidiphila cocklensis]WSX78948.1 hypothetical protein OH826_36910 [Streptomyces sp. NBC_00899]CAG6393844.1 conserved hypothetical protein [Actinacidiphila cocklensis]
MTTYGTILIPMPLEQAAPVLRAVCAAGYATAAGPGFCLAHPDRFVEGNDIFSLAGPISSGSGVPVLAAFQYDGDRLELEVWRDGVRAHRYDSRPPRGDDDADSTPANIDPAAFLDFAAGPVDSHRLSSALADTPIDEEEKDVDGDPGYVWAQGLHWDVLQALGHPDGTIQRAQWDYRHMHGAPQTLAKVLDSTELVVLGAAENPF